MVGISNMKISVAKGYEQEGFQHCRPKRIGLYPVSHAEWTLQAYLNKLEELQMTFVNSTLFFLQNNIKKLVKNVISNVFPNFYIRVKDLPYYLVIVILVTRAVSPYFQVSATTEQFLKIQNINWPPPFLRHWT